MNDKLPELKRELKRLDGMIQRVYVLVQAISDANDPDAGTIVNALKLGHNLLITKREKVFQQIENIEG